MTQTMQSGFITTLAAKLEPSDTTMTVATAPTVTKGRLFLTDGQQKEWIKYTGVSSTTLTGLVRGLSQTADPSTAGTGLTWIAGTKVKLVEMHDQRSDKQEGLPVRIYDDTTARDADITSPSNGMSCYVTAEGTFTDYIAGAWANRPTSAVSDGQNASTTVAGRAEVATSAETIAGTDTGGTGAKLIPLPSDIAKNIQSGTFIKGTAAGTDTYTLTLTPTLTAYATGNIIQVTFTNGNTGASTLNIDSLGAKAIQTLAGGALVSGDIAAGGIYILYYDGTQFKLINSVSASETRSGISERATDAEVVTGTDTTRYTSSKSVHDKINKTIRFNSGDIAPNNALIATGVGSGAEGRALADASTTGIVTQYRVNGSYTSISSIVFHTIPGGTNTGDLRLEFTINRYRAATAIQTDTETATYAYAATVNQPLDITINAAAFNGITTQDGDMIGIQLQRIGGDAADTYNTYFTIHSLTITLA